MGSGVAARPKSTNQQDGLADAVRINKNWDNKVHSYAAWSGLTTHRGARTGASCVKKWKSNP